jgi:hypothetical protein
VPERPGPGELSRDLPAEIMTQLVRALVTSTPWPAADAMPSQEEITRLRALIGRVTDGPDDLTAADRAEIDEAVAVVRRHPTVMLGMPRTRHPAGSPTCLTAQAARDGRRDRAPRLDG